MNSEHYALDKFTTTVDEIHQAHQTREKSLNDQFSKFGQQAEALSKMMEENFRGICERMQDERNTLKRKLEDERKVILERAKRNEEPDHFQFQAAQLLWYEAQRRSADQVKLQLQRDLEAAKSSVKTSTETDECFKVKKENRLLLLKVSNLTAKS